MPSLLAVTSQFPLGAMASDEIRAMCPRKDVATGVVASMSHNVGSFASETPTSGRRD